MPRYFAKKARCLQGHTHDSKKEAARCDVLHDMQRRGEIEALVVSPVFYFEINGTYVKMGNGQRMKFTADFAYFKAGKRIVEDVKASNGFLSRDVPLKLALLRHLRPDLDIRLVT